MLQRVPFVWSKSGLLLFSHLLRGDFRQLVRAGFTDEDGNFVIGWLAAMLHGESLDCGVPLRAPHAVLFEQFIRDTTNLESMIFAFGIAARLYLVSQTAHLTRQRVPVNLRQVCTPFIQPRCLQRLPAALHAVIGQIGSNGMCVQLRIEFTAGVVTVCGDNPVGGRAILVRTVQPDTRCSVALGFCKRLPDSFVVSRDQALIPADERLNGNRLRRGKGQIVQRPPFALLASVLADAVRTVPRPKELSGLRMQPLADRFKLLPGHFSAQAEQLRAASMPFTLNAAVLIVVVAVFEMPLGIPGTARHGSYRQHNPTLTLFEFRMQRLASDKVADSPSRRMPCRIASCVCTARSCKRQFGTSRPKSLLAALVLKIDTIPKPDGLGLRNA